MMRCMKFGKNGVLTSSRTGARNIELLTPLVDSILKHWDSATFDLEVLIHKAETSPPNYVF